MLIYHRIHQVSAGQLYLCWSEEYKRHSTITGVFSCMFFFSFGEFIYNLPPLWFFEWSFNLGAVIHHADIVVSICRHRTPLAWRVFENKTCITGVTSITDKKSDWRVPVARTMHVPPQTPEASVLEAVFERQNSHAAEETQPVKYALQMRTDVS